MMNKFLNVPANLHSTAAIVSIIILSKVSCLSALIFRNHCGPNPVVEDFILAL